MVTVASFRDPWEAQMFRMLLEAEGVPASVAFAFHIGNNWLWSTALSGAHVQVPRRFALQAQEAYRLCLDGFYRQALAAELGDLDERCCPRCGSQEFERRQPLLALLIVLALVAFPTLPAWGWLCVCRQCGQKFRIS